MSDLQITTAGGSDDIYNLDDDLVKLVVYSIISVRRDCERFLEKATGQIVVTDSMRGEDFMNWMIAKYLQSIEKDQSASKDVKTDKDQSAPKDVKPESDCKDAKYTCEDRKYLRIHYAVVRRWPREPMRFEERQVEEIRKISRYLK